MTVYERLLAAPHEFDFAAALRVLTASARGRASVGGEAAPADEAVRFRPHLSLAFPPSQLVALDPPDEFRPQPLLTVAFLGLYGPSRVLPTHYTQLLLDTHRDVRGPERRALRDWLDLFNHRLISLFHRASHKYRFPVAFERGDARRPGGDTFTLAVRSVMGFGTPGLANRLAVRRAGEESAAFTWPDVTAEAADLRAVAKVDDLALLYYAGLFAQQPRNAANLRALLADYFGLPVAVEQFRGQWLAVPEADRTILGGHGTLGVDALAGERVWDVQSGFRIVLGPLSRTQFEELLPDRTPQPQRKMLFLVNQLARTFVGPEYDFDVQLVLAAADVPATELGQAAGLGARLGWNVWTISETPSAPVGDAVFDGEWVTAL